MVGMYSGKQVIRAGERFLDKDLMIKNPEEYFSAMDVLSYWRLIHERPLDIAFTMLQDVANKRDRTTVCAKRLKRFVSIEAKLRRFSNMKLKNMQDIGGCRAIVRNEKRLHQLIRDLRRRPEFKNAKGEIRASDYIQEPKDDGYRGYHLIGFFGDAQAEKRNIEIQIRTAMQHSWATALEIVDLFTGQALKSNLGDEEWSDFFKCISEQLNVMDSIHLFETLHPNRKFRAYGEKVLSDKKLTENCRKAQKSIDKLNVLDKFEAYAQSLRVVDEKLSEEFFNGFALIKVNVKKHEVELSLFPEDRAAEAEDSYIEEEKIAAKSKDVVVALVSTTAVGGLKEAYPNYFGDSSNFVKHVHMVKLLELPSVSGWTWRDLLRGILQLKYVN